MDSTEYFLNEFLSATVDSFGFGYASTGPVLLGEWWMVRTINVSNDGANATVLEVFDDPIHTRRREGTYAGRLDTTNTEFRLTANQKLYFRWKNGTVGSRCTATLIGSKYLRGDRGGGIR